MTDMESIGRELDKIGGREELRRLARSEDGQRLGEMFSPQELSRALKSGDSAGLRGIMEGVLKTEEGRRMTESLLKLLGGGGSGSG